MVFKLQFGTNTFISHLTVFNLGLWYCGNYCIENAVPFGDANVPTICKIFVNVNFFIINQPLKNK